MICNQKGMKKMTKKEALNKWVLPALQRTWNEKKVEEILKALEWESIAQERHTERTTETLEYYMVFNAKGSGYGGFETLEEALKSIKTRDFLNNDDDSYDRVIKVVEIMEEVYRVTC